MSSLDISRRRFVVVAAATPVILSAADPLTANDVIGRIQRDLGGDWPANGPDGFKAGDPSTTVKGIATTAMATLDVLKQAVAANANLVITYEPTFYSRADGQAPAAGKGKNGPPPAAAPDPVLEAKQAFIRDNGLVVYRLRDHWQARRSNDMVVGLASALGWSAGAVANDIFTITPATAEATVAQIRSKLNLRGGLRVVGDRAATIRRVWLYPGSMSTAIMWQRYREADMIVAGEVREWENTHFAADLLTAGRPPALVTTGRIVSEDPGMRACAEWIATIAPEVPATWIPVGDPYWRPA